MAVPFAIAYSCVACPPSMGHRYGKRPKGRSQAGCQRRPMPRPLDRAASTKPSRENSGPPDWQARFVALATPPQTPQGCAETGPHQYQANYTGDPGASITTKAKICAGATQQEQRNRECDRAHGVPPGRPQPPRFPRVLGQLKDMGPGPSANNRVGAENFGLLPSSGCLLQRPRKRPPERG